MPDDGHTDSGGLVIGSRGHPLEIRVCLVGTIFQFQRTRVSRRRISAPPPSAAATFVYLKNVYSWRAITNGTSPVSADIAGAAKVLNDVQ
ncbi:hypothetical protein EVAR_75681_1 [Eumeta japonica]|uniref:Uncharacterized protein n=1 Tax=Eumeta variegata TaxID=151549 RepID=A0A4C1W179_EUMVA|nr:hypothetical protein EVAR_75681_1 [Eumeta japonica]